MPRALKVILIAHDGRKDSLVEWTQFNRQTLARCELIATLSTGQAVQTATGLPVRLLLSGPRGGDAQAGALIATDEGRTNRLQSHLGRFAHLVAAVAEVPDLSLRAEFASRRGLAG